MSHHLQPPASSPPQEPLDPRVEETVHVPNETSDEYESLNPEELDNYISNLFNLIFCNQINLLHTFNRLEEKVAKIESTQSRIDFELKRISSTLDEMNKRLLTGEKSTPKSSYSTQSLCRQRLRLPSSSNSANSGQ